jgi:uncharacterized protein DUF4440
MREMAIRKLVFIAGVLLASPAACQQNSALREQLASRYAAMKTAMANKDEGAIRALLADGFTSVDANGKSEDADEMISEVVALPADTSRHSETTITSVKADKRTALVQQRYDMTSKKTDPNGAGKSIALSTLSTDTWVNVDGTWRIARTVTRQLDYSVDGVTLAHQVNRNSE